MTRDEVKSKLKEFEKKYQIDSERFYELWISGEAPEGVDTLIWVALWEAWEGLYQLRE